MDILNNLDEETKSLLYLRLKIGIEDCYYFQYSTKEFELKRLYNIQNLKQILVQTECKKCKGYTPILIDIQELINKHFGELDESCFFHCKKCNLRRRKQ